MPVPKSASPSFKSMLMLSMPAADRLKPCVSMAAPNSRTSSAPCVLSVMFKASFSASLRTPSKSLSPNKGKGAMEPSACTWKSPAPKSKVISVPSAAPTIATASTPNFCKSFRLVLKCVPAVASTFKLIVSSAANANPSTPANAAASAWSS